MKRIASLLIVLFLFCGAMATAEETVETRSDSTGIYEYVLLEDGSAEITGYSGDAEVLEIPAELDGYSVTSIGERAFFFCKNLTSVTIPDSVASIGINPFLRCAQLQTIQVSPDHPVLATIDGVLFEKTTKTLICYPGGLDAAEYAIPEGILSIGENAFSGCKNLTSVIIPDSMTSIGDSAFSGCFGLTSITIPDSVTSIGNYAFSSCPLTSITIPDSVTSIGNNAFMLCYNLTSITLPDSLTSISDNTFSGCRNLTSITIPDSVITIGEKTFRDCFALTSVTIPDSVTSIGKSAFDNCSDNLVLTVGRDSYAKSYAEENGISYTYPDANDWLNS